MYKIEEIEEVKVRLEKVNTLRAILTDIYNGGLLEKEEYGKRMQELFKIASAIKLY